MKALTSQPMGRSGRRWPRAGGLVLPVVAILSVPTMIARGSAAATVTAASATGSLLAWEMTTTGSSATALPAPATRRSQ
jgi:hypothetical protein